MTGVIAPRRVHRYWAIPLAVLAGLVVVTVVVTALLPASLVATNLDPDPDNPGEQIEVEAPYARVPAAAQPVADRVSYGDVDSAGMASAGMEGVEVDTDPDGRVYFVTIQEPAQSVLGHLLWGGGPEIETLSRRDKYGDQTPTQRRTVSLQMMRTSEQVAQYVALSRAGFEADVVPGPVQVEYFYCLEVVDAETCGTWVPSEAQLEVGDTITEVDGTPIVDREDLSEVLVGRDSGDTVDVTVDRIDVGAVELTDVELISAEDGTDRVIFGFSPFDTDSVSLPFEVRIDTGDIGGPSAGLAFTLTLLDELTGGDLLGGLDVAVTGSIGIRGNVGAIGGLAQKASAVRQAGLDYFIVPASQSEADLERAREVAGDDVEIITVATVDEAIAALETLGGDPPEVLT